MHICDYYNRISAELGVCLMNNRMNCCYCKGNSAKCDVVPPIRRKLTIEEIEKKLGYKIEIVDKEDK